ncbi:MAG: 3,4-dihydroxy-2-butanone-4-phosphate synthase [gamma proteobacterium endosymbiont of Trioza apicalis]
MYYKIIFNKLNYIINKINNAIRALYYGHGVLVFDNENRENESDIIFPSEKITIDQMSLTIRYGSGIICLCLIDDYCYQLKIPMMVKSNNSRYRTGFTISIESYKVTTGVSSTDRLNTIFTAISDNLNFKKLKKPGHIFPLCTKPGGILERKGHTEAAVDLITMAGLKSTAILCEITNDNGSMARTLEIKKFSKIYNINLITIKDLFIYRKKQFFM